MRSDLIDIDVEFKHATAAAILVSPDGEKEVWLPKSAVEWPEDTARRGQVISITLSRRLAEDKGLV